MFLVPRGTMGFLTVWNMISRSGPINGFAVFNGYAMIRVRRRWRELEPLLKENAMAKDGSDNVTQGLVLSVDDKQWLKVAVMNQIRALERQMAKYPANSGAWSAHEKDVSTLKRIKEML